MEIDEQKEVVKDIAAVKALVAKEKTEKFTPVKSKKCNKRTYEREVKRRTTYTNPYDSLSYDEEDDAEMTNCEETAPNNTVDNNMDVSMEDTEDSTEDSTDNSKIPPEKQVDITGISSLR